jgi:hypothetical protein
MPLVISGTLRRGALYFLLVVFTKNELLKAMYRYLKKCVRGFSISSEFVTMIMHCLVDVSSGLL